MAGQSINDRLTAARYSIAGQGLARSVCKATTEEIMGPKKKHLDYLLHCTNEPNVSIPQLANLLIERTTNSNWVVVFKSLVTVHHLMCYGNERFTQYLASSNCSFQLSNFLDKNGYEMSTSIRRYSKYLNEKALSYRTVAFDFCKVKRGKEDGLLRTMDADKLLKTIPPLQSQIDNLLDFDCSANELTNGVINSCFMLLFRDLIRLFACYNDGIINLLEKYFDMNKKNCRDALDLYKKFLIRMDRVAEFLKVAENVGIDKGDIPDLAKAPSSLLDALEAHLENLEGKKGSTSSSHLNSVKHAVSAFSNTSNAFGTASTGGTAGSAPNSSNVNGFKVDENTKQMLLDEEKAVLEQHKKDLQQAVDFNQEVVSTERRMKELQTNQTKSTNPFLASPSAETTPIQQTLTTQQSLDLLGAGSPPSVAADTKASDDLLCLSSNPFADNVLNTKPSQPTPTNGSTWNTNGFPAPAPSKDTFLNENAFAAAFGEPAPATSAGSGFDAFGDILMPQSGVNVPKSSANPITKAPAAAAAAPQQSVKVMTGDLDTSLASLVQNLDMADPRSKTNRQWNNSPKNVTKTGGANWSANPSPMQAAGTGVGWTGQQSSFIGMSNRPAGNMMQGGQMHMQSGMFPQQGMQPSSNLPMANVQARNATPSQNQNSSDPFGNL